MNNCAAAAVIDLYKVKFFFFFNTVTIMLYVMWKKNIYIYQKNEDKINLFNDQLCTGKMKNWETDAADKKINNIISTAHAGIGKSLFYITAVFYP